MKKITIGFYSSRPLEDKRNWSGTMYKMYEQILKHGYEVVWVPVVQLSESQQKIYSFIEKSMQKIFNRGYNQHINLYKSLVLAKKLKNAITRQKIDILFAPTAVCELAFLKTDIPIIYLNDANIAQLLNYYPYYSGFGILSKRETLWLERKTLNNVDVAIFSSEWAVDFAKKHYRIPTEKIKLLKFGANLEVPEHLPSRRAIDGEYRFLFLAVNWERKRGDLAFETLKILKNKGYNVKLTIVGCEPNIQENWVEIIPFLNKNNPADLQKIQDFLLTSHFLFVPTEADCTPIVFCEASGYGLPIISTDTGGVSAHIENGKTGILLPKNATAEDYAHEIEKLLQHPEQILEKSQNARTKYEKELNWENWGNQFNDIIKNILSQ